MRGADSHPRRRRGSRPCGGRHPSEGGRHGTPVPAPLATAGDRFLLARLRLMISTPALRARHLDNHYALQQAILDALGDEVTDPDTAFRARAAAGACLAAMHTALVRWAEDDGRTELPHLIAQALVAAFGADAVDIGPVG
ncbi:acyl-CoA-like ligand-binding transcription factor [Streptomyces sp. NPDC054844]